MPYGLWWQTERDLVVAEYLKYLRRSRLYFVSAYYLTSEIHLQVNDVKQGESVVHGPFEISKEVQLLEDKLRLRLPISSAVNGQQERQRHSSSTATSQVFDLSDIILVIAGWISCAI